MRYVSSQQGSNGGMMLTLQSSMKADYFAVALADHEQLLAVMSVLSATARRYCYMPV
jgi:hypothetical protein